jgi:hypothetical protein
MTSVLLFLTSDNYRSLYENRFNESNVHGRNQIPDSQKMLFGKGFKVFELTTGHNILQQSELDSDSPSDWLLLVFRLWETERGLALDYSECILNNTHEYLE